MRAVVLRWMLYCVCCAQDMRRDVRQAADVRIVADSGARGYVYCSKRNSRWVDFSARSISLISGCFRG